MKQMIHQLEHEVEVGLYYAVLLCSRSRSRSLFANDTSEKKVNSLHKCRNVWPVFRSIHQRRSDDIQNERKTKEQEAG